MTITRKQKMYVKSFWPWYDIEFRKDGNVYGKRKSDDKGCFGILLTKQGLSDLLETMNHETK